MYYYSSNLKYGAINLKTVSIATDKDYVDLGIFCIDFVINGGKIKWDYFSKEIRDKELAEIKAELAKYGG